MVLKFILIAG